MESSGDLYEEPVDLTAQAEERPVNRGGTGKVGRAVRRRG